MVIGIPSLAGLVAGFRWRTSVGWGKALLVVAIFAVLQLIALRISFFPAIAKDRFYGRLRLFVAEVAVGAHFFGSVTGHAATHADVAFAIHLFAFGDWAVAVFAFAAGLEVRAMAEPNKRGRLVDADPGDLLATLGGGG